MKFRIHSILIRFSILWIIFALAAFFAWHELASVRLPFVWEALIALNVASFLLFGLDKFIAGGKVMRIPENILYLATFIGGSAGALLAMHIFHHKTRKISFQLVMALLVIIQIGIVWWLYRSKIGPVNIK